MSWYEPNTRRIELLRRKYGGVGRPLSSAEEGELEGLQAVAERRGRKARRQLGLLNKDWQARRARGEGPRIFVGEEGLREALEELSEKEQKEQNRAVLMGGWHEPEDKGGAPAGKKSK